MRVSGTPRLRTLVLPSRKNSSLKMVPTLAPSVPVNVGVPAGVSRFSICAVQPRKSALSAACGGASARIWIPPTIAPDSKCGWLSASWEPGGALVI